MLLHIYFAGKFAKNFAITLSIFIIFMLLIDIIEQLRRFAVSIDYIEIFFLALLNLPGSVDHNFKFRMDLSILSPEFRTDCLQSSGKIININAYYTSNSFAFNWCFSNKLF
jgi:hypothetical protein